MRQPAEALLLGYALDALADIERRTSRTDAAARLAQEAVAILDHNDCKDHPAVAFAHVRAGAARWADGYPNVGEPEMRSGLDVLTRRYPEGHAQLAGARFLLGDALARSGRASEAQAVARSRSRVAGVPLRRAGSAHDHDPPVAGAQFETSASRQVATPPISASSRPASRPSTASSTGSIRATFWARITKSQWDSNFFQPAA